MAQSAVDVCNSALLRIGARAIMSLGDNSPEARACSVAYDSNRRDELRLYPWNFAIKRAVLAPDVAEPAFDFGYQFTMPADCIRVLRPRYTTLDWQIEGRKILTNDGNVLYLRYLADIEDPAQWDPSFYNVFAIALAIDLVDKITNSNAKRSNLQAEYKDAVKDARRADAFESGPQEAPEDPWWLVRY